MQTTVKDKIKGLLFSFVAVGSFNKCRCEEQIPMNHTPCHLCRATLDFSHSHNVVPQKPGHDPG